MNKSVWYDKCFTPSIRWMSPLHSCRELSHSWASSLSLRRYLELLVLHCLQLLSSLTSSRRRVLESCTVTTGIHVAKHEIITHCLVDHDSYLSLRFSAMVLGSSLMDLSPVGFSSCLLTKFPHFPLLEELSRVLELLLRLLAVDDFLRYNRDW